MKQYIVPFYGDQIQLVENEGQAFVPIRPICERLGVKWSAQHRKLTDENQRWCVSIIRTPDAQNRLQEMICLPLRRFFAWLITIHPNKVKESVRNALIRYQTECDAVLESYWLGKHNERETYLMVQAASMTNELLARKPIYLKVKGLVALGCNFATIHRTLNYSRARLIDALHQLQWLGMIDAIPDDTPSPKPLVVNFVHPDLFGGA